MKALLKKLQKKVLKVLKKLQMSEGLQIPERMTVPGLLMTPEQMTENPEMKIGSTHTPHSH
jgi:hypothetical protein